MKKFILKLSLFIFPIAMMIFPFLLAGWKTKELFSINYITNLQEKNQDFKVGLYYHEDTPYYKLRSVNMRNPKVIALGTSRVMQFKGNYFSDSFYNCGGAVSRNYDEYLNFLLNLENNPEYLIMGLDQWTFNDAWNERYTNNGYWTINETKIELAGLIKRMILDWLDGKWSFKGIYSGQENLGLNAVLNGDGFLYDGSYYYYQRYIFPEKQKDYEFRDTLERIEEGTARFEYGEDIDEETLLYLKNFLDYCNDEKIEVVLFMPPFAPTVLDAMDSTGKYAYIDKIFQEVLDIAQEYGYEVYDFTDVGKLGCNDGYFVDGFHGGEIVYAKIIQEMCDQGSTLCDVIDGEKLDRMIENRYSDKLFEECK